jgi:serine protease
LKHPSFNFSYDKEQLKTIFISNLAVSKIRSLKQGRYLVFLKYPFLTENLITIKPGCYSAGSVQKLISQMQSNSEISDVMPNIMMQALEIDSREMMISPLQWNLLAAPGGVEVADAWKLLSYKKKSNIVVAVMDTGILAHQSLDLNLLYWGYKGEHPQWSNGPSNAEDAGVSFTDNGDSWMLGASPSCKKCIAAMHGTHVAGIIAASGELAYGETVYGVAPQSFILPINVFTKLDDPDICDGLKNTPCTISYAADQLNAQSWLDGQAFSGLPLAPTAKIINMSIGGIGRCSKLAQESFNHLLNKNMSIVVAAGNSNINAEETYPAGCPQVISVAATGPSGERAWYSNWGKSITIAAPGGNSLNPVFNAPANQIYSTIAHAYKFLQGTSMASPMVAGVVALMYTFEPNLNQKQVVQIITKHSNTTTFPREEELLPSLISCISEDNPEHLCGAGIINAKKIMQYMLKNSLIL